MKRLMHWLEDDTPLYRDMLAWAESDGRPEAFHEVWRFVERSEEVKTWSCFWCCSLAVAWCWAVCGFVAWLGSVL